MSELNLDAAGAAAKGNQADALAAVPHSPREARKRLTGDQYFDYVELAFTLRREGASWQEAEARAFAAILARMRWPVFKEGT